MNTFANGELLKGGSGDNRSHLYHILKKRRSQGQCD